MPYVYEIEIANYLRELVKLLLEVNKKLELLNELLEEMIKRYEKS